MKITPDQKARIQALNNTGGLESDENIAIDLVLMGAVGQGKSSLLRTLYFIFRSREHDVAYKSIASKHVATTTTAEGITNAHSHTRRIYSYAPYDGLTLRDTEGMDFEFNKGAINQMLSGKLTDTSTLNNRMTLSLKIAEVRNTAHNVLSKTRAVGKPDYIECNSLCCVVSAQSLFDSSGYFSVNPMVEDWLKKICTNDITSIKHALCLLVVTHKDKLPVHPETEKQWEINKIALRLTNKYNNLHPGMIYFVHNIVSSDTGVVGVMQMESHEEEVEPFITMLEHLQSTMQCTERARR